MSVVSICLGVLISAMVPAGETKPEAAPAQAAQKPINLAHIDARFVAGYVARPRQILNSPVGRAMIDTAFRGDEYDESMEKLSEEFGLNPANIEQVAMLFTERNIAAINHIDMPAARGPGQVTQNQKNNLKNLALAFHNFHDVYNRFPGEVRRGKGKLSWRVHILPFIEEIDLYEQFDPNEDWDGPTNKPLLAKMPDIFRSPGVEAAGKTSIHLTNLAFPENRRVRFRDILDGSSNTIMHVVAGPDKAVEWTKPSRLEIDAEDPWGSLGDINGAVPVTMCDGAFRRIPRSTEPDMLRALMTAAGAEQVWDIVNNDRSGPNPEQTPTFIVHTADPIDQAEFLTMWTDRLGDPEKRRGNGNAYYDFDGISIWFPTARSLVATPTSSLPAVMSKDPGKSNVRDVLTANRQADFVAFLDIEGMPTVARAIGAERPPFIPPSLLSIRLGTLVIDLSSESRPLAEAIVQTDNVRSAKKLCAMINGLWAVVTDIGEGIVTEAPAEVQDSLRTGLALIDTVEAVQRDKHIVYSVPKPADYQAAIDRFNAEFEKLGEAMRIDRERARRRARTGNFRMLGIAFHNHHDVYNNFGKADGSIEGRKPGLSWRVHMLPFLDQGRLYKQFRLDEPWDSPHNKKLIARMPDVFKVEGVEDGKTSIHVLSGRGMLFEGDAAKGIDDCIDGTSQTLLAVQAGADKAEIWTKPGGLVVDWQNPTASLGQIGEEFQVLFADGSVTFLSKTINRKVLAALMTNAGREVIDLDDF